jgi:hypothetical protein
MRHIELTDDQWEVLKDTLAYAAGKAEATEDPEWTEAAFSDVAEVARLAAATGPYEGTVHVLTVFDGYEPYGVIEDQEVCSNRPAFELGPNMVLRTATIDGGGSAPADTGIEPVVEEQMREHLRHILFESGVFENNLDAPRAALAQMTLPAAVDAFIGNCWDDHHDGGEHREDLRLAYRLLEWLGVRVDQLVYAEIARLGDHTDAGEPSPGAGA